MNCANHPDVPAVAYCRTCGKPLCSGCSRDVRGVIYCEECLASHLSGTMPPPGSTAVPPGVEPLADAPRPGLAALLGLIPGVGAMYNGEFAKGFIHVLIFATLIWMADHVNDIFGILIAAFYVYMPIEAYKTARAKQMGLPAPDPFGFNNMFGPAATRTSGAAAGTATANSFAEGVAAGQPPVAGTEPVEPGSRVPVGAVILIGLGVLFLLDEVGALHFDWIWRWWPLVLILLGVRILMQRQRRGY
jgi:TM2 domain-containing membrane protein YozV